MGIKVTRSAGGRREKPRWSWSASELKRALQIEFGMSRHIKMCTTMHYYWSSEYEHQQGWMISVEQGIRGVVLNSEEGRAPCADTTAARNPLPTPRRATPRHTSLERCGLSTCSAINRHQLPPLPPTLEPLLKSFGLPCPALPFATRQANPVWRISPNRDKGRNISQQR